MIPMESATTSLWREALWVGAGGFLGSVARYLVSALVTRWNASSFPLGTLTVNAIGCLAIGLAAGWLQTRWTPPSELRAFLLMGVLGGFTTFSAFGHEAASLARDGNPGGAFLHVSLHLVVGLGLAAAGFWLAGARA